MTDEEKQAIETMKHWIDYEKANKDKINKADELIEIQEIVLNLIEKQQKEYKKLKEDFEIVDHECSRLEKEDIRKDLKIKELQKELDKYKEMYAVSIADRVNSAFKQEHKNNEDLEMLYKGCQIELDTDYIPKSKIKEKIEELEHEKFKRTYLGFFPKYNCENRILLAKIQVLQELMEDK